MESSKVLCHYVIAQVKENFSPQSEIYSTEFHLCNGFWAFIETQMKRRKQESNNQEFDRGYQDFYRGLTHHASTQSYSDGWIRAFFHHKDAADAIVNHRNGKRKMKFISITTDNSVTIDRWVKS